MFAPPDKAAEILSSVCQTAREKKRKFADIVAAPGGASVSKSKSEMPVLSSSTLRATVTGKLHRDCPGRSTRLIFDLS
jgi:inositol hexakisphosphate/diphosphoinositol-pentakisphosphate kinase